MFVRRLPVSWLMFVVSAVGPVVGAGASAPAAVIPVFRLSGELPESPSELSALLGGTKPKTFRELTERLEQAGADGNVAAVVLVLDLPAVGLAQRQELAGTIRGLRAAGKDVHVFAEMLTLGDYVLASEATDVTVVPSGLLLLVGMNGQGMYLRGLLDKAGIIPEIVHIGEFKSAGEMLTHTGPSEAALEQINRLTDDIYAQILGAGAKRRQIGDKMAAERLTSGPYTAEEALELGLIDAVQPRKDFLEALCARHGGAELAPRYGQKTPKELDLSSPFALFQLFAEAMSAVQAPAKPSIAVVYVDGMIVDGKSEEGALTGKSAGSHTLRKALEQAAADETIKAVVMRVDSPGGSALASDIIWTATQRVRANKPFVVSMGNVAGSGGYFVACGAERIFADAATLTGSIGVVGGKLVTEEAWKKIGVTWFSNPRGRNAELYSTSRPFSEDERKEVMRLMGAVYETFKQRVVAGRGSRLKGDIEPLAGGRVYTGRQALEVGLVDELGGLSEALAYAARQANVREYELRILPAPKTLIDLIREALELDSDEDDLAVRSGRFTARDRLLEAALPVVQSLDPQRAAVLARGLRQAMMLMDGGVLAVQPFELVLP